MNRIKNRTERSAAIKMLVIFACFIGLAGLIIGRLAEYQLKMYDYYQTKVLNQLTIQTDVTPERGTITDRNGNIVPVKNQSPKQRIDGTAALLDCYVGLYEHYNEFTGAI